MRLACLAGLLLAAGCASVPPLPPRADALNTEGAEALAGGDLAAAEVRLDLALAYAPRFTEAWVNRGLVELGRGNLDQAHARFAKARSLNPDLPTPHHGLGLVLERRGKVDAAEKHYRAALKVDPGFVASRWNLARLLYARGAFHEAHGEFARLVALEPGAVEGHEGLVACLLKLDRDVEAEGALARARAAFGDDAPGLRLLVGRVLLRQGAHEEAERVLAAVTSAPDASRAGAAWAWIAVSRLAREDRRGAGRAAREALAVDDRDDVAGWVVRSLASR